MKPFFLAFGFLLLLADCTVQKRRYRPGYFVQHTKQTPNPAINALVKKNVRPLVTTKNNTVHQANQTFAVLAVAEHAQQVNEQSPKRFDSKISSLKKSSLPDTCDVLVFANGNELNVKVTEITPDEIKYYRCDIPNGPIHISRRSELFMIKYNNGSREMVQNKSTDKPAKGAIPKQNKITPDVVWVASLCCLIYFLSPIGLVLGIIGLEKIKRNPQKYKGKQVAILSILFSAMMILLFAMLMLVTFL